ncbi:MAG: N-acetylneuraminate synthase [Oscillospiraceae bacterium]
MSVYIIAEAGVNHNGDLSLAIELVKKAKEAGCDCIKFQTFSADRIVTKQALKAEYQIKNTNSNSSQYDMLKKLELSEMDFIRLIQECEKVNIDFMSSPFDVEDVYMLEKLKMSRFKIPSGEITNKPLLEAVASTNKPIILSTGMCTIEEVEQAVDWIYKKDNKDITLLHCTSNYPTIAQEVNMNAMLTLKEKFGVPIGYSDHTQGIVIPVMAVSMGAQVIEKHFTLDRHMSGPDHMASLEPHELAQMVNEIRIVEKAFGDGIKIPIASEIKTQSLVRKSIVALKDMKKGHTITHNDICCKRPGTGISPSKIEEIIGKRLNKDLCKDNFLSYEDFD